MIQPDPALRQITLNRPPDHSRAGIRVMPFTLLSSWFSYHLSRSGFRGLSGSLRALVPYLPLFAS